MSSMTIRARRFSVGVLLTAASAALLLATASSPAAAHDDLVASDPAADAVVGSTPAEITLTFSDAPSTEQNATEVAVFDEDCTPIADGDPTVDGNAVSQAIRGPVEGAVLVQWKVVSSDGHPLSDEYTFSVGEPGAVAAADQCAESAGEQAEGASEGFNGVPYAVGGGVIIAAVGVVLAVAIARGRRGETKE